MKLPKKAKSPDEQRAERERYVVRKTLEEKYKQRFTIAKEGKMALNRRDYRMMIYRYSEYLKIMADTFEVGTIYDLKPAFFDAMLIFYKKHYANKNNPIINWFVYLIIDLKKKLS